MADQVPKSVRNERVSRLQALETELRNDYYEQLVGRRVQLLVESSRDIVQLSPSPTDRNGRLLRGTTCRYAPAELLTPVGSSPATTGEMIEVQVDHTDGERLYVVR